MAKANPQSPKSSESGFDLSAFDEPKSGFDLSMFNEPTQSELKEVAISARPELTPWQTTKGFALSLPARAKAEIGEIKPFFAGEKMAESLLSMTDDLAEKHPAYSKAIKYI